MNELDKALADFIRQTIAGAGQLKDFVVAELPDYVQQLLQWYMVKGALMCAIGVALPIFVVWISRPLLVKLVESFKDDDFIGVQIFGTIGAVIVAVMMLVLSVEMLNLDWLQIWIAPKVWLVEYASGLVK